MNHPPLPPLPLPMGNDNMQMNNINLKNENPTNHCPGPGCVNGCCCCFPQKNPELAYQTPPQKFPMPSGQPFYHSMTPNPMNSPKSGFQHPQSAGFYPNSPVLPQMAYNFAPPPTTTGFCIPPPTHQIQSPPPYFPNQFPNFPPPPYFNGSPTPCGPPNQQQRQQQQQQSQYRSNINNNNNNNTRNNNNNNNTQGLKSIPCPLSNPENPSSFNNCSFYYSGIPSLNPWHLARLHNYRSGINSAAGDDQLAPVPRLFKSELRNGTMYFGLGKSCYCKERPCTTARPDTRYQDQYFKGDNSSSERFEKYSRGSKFCVRKIYPDEWPEDELQPQQNYEGKDFIDDLSLSTDYKTEREHKNNNMNNVLNNLYRNTNNRNNINGARTTTNQLYINCHVQVPPPHLRRCHFCHKYTDEHDEYDNDYDYNRYDDKGNMYNSDNNINNNIDRWKQHNIEDFKRLEMINNYYNKTKSRLLVEQNRLSPPSKPIISTAKNNRYRNTFLVPAPSPQSIIIKHDENAEKECKENEENNNVVVKVFQDSTTSTNDLSSLVQGEDEKLTTKTFDHSKEIEWRERGRDRTKKSNNKNRQQGQSKSHTSLKKESLNNNNNNNNNSSSSITIDSSHRTKINSQDTLVNAFDNLSSDAESFMESNEDEDEKNPRMQTASIESKEFSNNNNSDDDTGSISNSDTDDENENNNDNDNNNNDDDDNKRKNKKLLEIFRPLEPKKESSYLIVNPPLLLSSRRSGIVKTQSGPFVIQKETNEILINNERKTVSMFPIKRKRRKSARHCHHKVYIPKFNNYPNPSSDKVKSKSNHEENSEEIELNTIKNDSNNNNNNNEDTMKDGHFSAEVLVKKKSSWEYKNSKEEINYAEHNYCVMPVTICVKNRCCSPCCKPCCCSPRCSPARVTVWQTFPFNCTPSCNTTGCGPCCCSPCCPKPPTAPCRPVCCCPIGPPPIPPANRPTCCTPPPCPPPRCPERCKKPKCCKTRCCRSCSPCFTERSCCSRSASPCCRPKSCSPCSTICPCPCPPKPCCPPPCCPSPCCPTPPCCPCPPKCCRRKRCPSPCCPCPEPCCVVCPPPCPPKCCPKPRCCPPRCCSPPPCCPPKCCSPPPCCPPKCCSPPPCCPPCCPPRPKRCCRVDRCCSPCPPCCPPCCPPPRPPPPCCPRRPPRCCPPPCCPCPCPCPPPPPCIPAPCPSPCKKKRRRRKCCCCCCPKEHIPLPQSTIIRCCPIPQACCCVNPCLCNVQCPQMCCN